MILTCPACAARFLVSAQAIGPEGREVRCAKCAHQWHAYPQQAEVEELVLEPGDDFETEAAPEIIGDEEPQESDTDSEAEAAIPDFDDDILARLAAAQETGTAANKAASPWQHPIWKAGVAVFALLAIFLLLLVMREPLQQPLSKFYAALGYTAEDGLTLAGVSVEKLPSRNKQRYELHCSILNKGKEARAIPKLRMQIINDGGSVVAEDDDFLPETGRILKPGKRFTCEGLKFENPSSSADRLVIDLGSKFELKLRGSWQEPESATSADSTEDENQDG